MTNVTPSGVDTKVTVRVGNQARPEAMVDPLARKYDKAASEVLGKPTDQTGESLVKQLYSGFGHMPKG